MTPLSPDHFLTFSHVDDVVKKASPAGGQAGPANADWWQLMTLATDSVANCLMFSFRCRNFGKLLKTGIIPNTSYKQQPRKPHRRKVHLWFRGDLGVVRWGNIGTSLMFESGQFTTSKNYPSCSFSNFAGDLRPKHVWKKTSGGRRWRCWSNRWKCCSLSFFKTCFSEIGCSLFFVVICGADFVHL